MSSSVSNGKVKIDRPHRKLAFIVFAILLLVLAAGGTYYFMHWRTAKKTDKEGNFAPAKIIKFTDSQQQQLDALKASNSGNKAAGLTAADKAIASASTDQDKARAFMTKGSVCFQAKDYACAASNYAKASDLQPKNAGYAGTAAQAYEQAGDKPNAIIYYKRNLPLASDTVNPDGKTGKQVIQAKITELGG